LITIPPRIVNRENDEYISLLERLLYDNSSPRPPKDFYAIRNTIIESIPTFPIPIEDSDSLREEIDIFPGPADSIPLGIESDDYDSEGDDNSTSLPEFESFHVDYPDSGDLTIDVVEDIPVDVPNILPNHPTLHMDFDFISSHNDLGSDHDVSSPSGDRNKIYDQEICIKNDSFAFVHELKKEMHAEKKYVESLKNEIDELESDKSEFSNMYDMECECLAQKLPKQTEFVSKEVYTELLQSFAKLEKYLISLELTLQQCQKQMKNDTVCKEKASNLFQKEREQYFKIQDLKAQLQDKNIAISELKKLIEKCKVKSVETKFDKPFVVRQPNAQRILKLSVLGKPAPFSDSLERKNFAKKKSVPKTNESEGVAHGTNVSRPQPRSTQMKDKVVPNTSQVKFKKTKVEDHHRISSISNQTKSVTACNDSLKSRTSNVNDVCATCGKCVFNSNHDACVYKFLNDVNARTKKPNVVPISTRKPKSQC
ncbi:hypothetical protein Tco_0754267, partial [Tanacetum coccineum]